MSLQPDSAPFMTDPGTQTPAVGPDPRLAVARFPREDGEVITMAKRLLGPGDVVRLPVQDMGATVLNTPGGPALYNGVVACLTLYEESDTAATQRPLSEGDVTMAALAADIKNQTIIPHKLFAIAQGKHYAGAFSNGLDLDPLALATPLPYTPKTIGEQKKLDTQLRAKSVVEGGISFISGAATDYGATIIPNGDSSQLAGLTVNPETGGIELFSLNQDNLAAIRTGELRVTGWQSVSPDGSVSVYERQVFLTEPGNTFERLVVEVSDPTDLTLQRVGSEKVRLVQQLIGSSAARELNPTGVIPNVNQVLDNTPPASASPFGQEEAAIAPPATAAVGISEGSTVIDTSGGDEDEPDLLKGRGNKNYVWFTPATDQTQPSAEPPSRWSNAKSLIHPWGR